MATTPSVADLVDRIHRLEQSAHRWRLGAIGLGLLLATGAAGPDAPAVVPEVRTRKLLLVDDRDRPCAVLPARRAGLSSPTRTTRGTSRPSSAGGRTAAG